jgi:hypothetical protein
MPENDQEMTENTQEIIQTEVGPYTALASTLIDQLHAFREQIPRFAFAPSKHASKRMITLASVPIEFIYQVTSAVKNEPELTGKGIAGHDELRDLTEFGIAFTGVAHEMEWTTKATQHTVMDAMATAAAEALNIYALAKRLARKPGNGHLIPVVEKMRESLGRTRPHPRKKATEAVEDAATQE